MMQTAALAVFIGEGIHPPRPQADRQIGAHSSYLIACVKSNKDWREKWRKNASDGKLGGHFAICDQCHSTVRRGDNGSAVLVVVYV